MAGLSTKEFAELAGVTPAIVRANIPRGKVERMSNNKIDPENPLNRDFLEARKKKKSELRTSSWATRKKEAEVLKVESEAAYKRLQVQKLMGKLMPNDLVEKILTINIQSVFRQMENEFENIASLYCDRLGGDRGDLSNMVEQMRTILERTIKDAEERAKEEIESAIEEYSAIRSRGERR